MSGSIDSCDQGKSLSCLQSDLTIQQILNRNSNRFLIKELADLTGFHRNTTKKALIRLQGNHKIQSIGSGNYTSYFGQTVLDHYRQIGHSLILIFDVEAKVDEVVVEKLRSFGYALVRTNLNTIVDNTYVRNYPHKTLKDGLLHLKLSYPFTDIVQAENEDRIKSLVNLTLDETGTELTVSPCLCEGNSEDAPLCEMVAGALQAGIHIACQQLSSKITHGTCTANGCHFIISDTSSSDEDTTAFDELM